MTALLARLCGAAVLALSLSTAQAADAFTDAMQQAYAPYRAALYRCHNSIGRAMYYTTVTVIIGFSTLTLSNFTPTIHFGLLTVVAMTVAVLGALLLLPRLIVLLRPLGPEAPAA